MAGSRLLATEFLTLDRTGSGATTWTTCTPDQPSSLPIPPIQTLGITSSDDAPGSADASRWRFRRTTRPGQGRLSARETCGVMITALGAKTEGEPAACQAVRDWADFVHIPEIVRADVPGLKMITPYEVIGDGPRYLHLYEFEDENPDVHLREMGALIRARLDDAGFDAWRRHPERQLLFAGTYRRLDHPTDPRRPHRTNAASI